jgi:hypothetical protein
MAAPRDYLSHLPWKALKIVISNLPDLPSIFRLLEVSKSAKNIILSHVPNLASSSRTASTVQSLKKGFTQRINSYSGYLL